MGTPPQHVVYRDEGAPPPEWDVLEFRLTYEGPLLSTRVWIEPAPCDECGHTPSPPPDGKAAHKHAIRKHFHNQLKRLWDVHPVLRKWVHQSEVRQSMIGRRPPTKDAIADKYQIAPFRWLPLVTEQADMMCSLDVLYLRGDARGGLLANADIDNRMKTIVDALKIPKPSQMPRDETPNEDENPFFVLLEDDSLVTRLAVDADILLSPTSNTLGEADSRVVVSVKIWRTDPTSSMVFMF